MEHFTDIGSAAGVLDALGSEIRRAMLSEIAAGKSINLDTLARRVHLTNGAVTKHVRLLKEAGLINVETVSGKRGMQKKCSLRVEKLLLDLASCRGRDKTEFSLPIGQFSECEIQPSCGMLSATGYIGLKDQPEYFTYPQRSQAAALWFKSGRLTYTLPDVSHAGRPKEISLSLELAAKGAKGGRRAFVTLGIDSLQLARIAVEGEFTDRRGVLTPAWYDSRYGQYGKYVTLKVDQTGCYVDGEKKSDVTINSLKLKNFTLSAEGGLMLYGCRFGDYETDIEYRVKFQE